MLSPALWSEINEAEFGKLLVTAGFCAWCVMYSPATRPWIALRWRHGRDCVSNHQPHNCLLNRLFRRSTKKTPKLRVTGLCAGNSPGTGEFPAQMASHAGNVSIWWRHHGAGVKSKKLRCVEYDWIDMFLHMWDGMIYCNPYKYPMIILRRHHGTLHWALNQLSVVVENLS